MFEECITGKACSQHVLLCPQVNWTRGSVLFASGSPFPALCYDGCEPLQPAQANNAYIFPAVGYAAVLTHAKAIPNEVSTATEVLQQDGPAWHASLLYTHMC